MAEELRVVVAESTHQRSWKPTWHAVVGVCRVVGVWHAVGMWKSRVGVAELRVDVAYVGHAVAAFDGTAVI